MRKTINGLILICILIATPLFGQYWQQDVEYDMDVLLDAEEKTLTATSDLLYVNHSPDTLNSILMHLYHNAFNEGTIAQQIWEDYGEALDLDKGWTGIKIEKAVSESTDLDYLIRDDTILDIALNKKLSPGDTVRLTLNWVALIHPHIDRSGWKRQQFDFAQWYPKFVVYDETGWHDDPFGDWGEFYGEYGNFKVHLDLPAEQIVGASGVVIDGDPGWSNVSVDTSQTWDSWVEDFRKDRGEYLVAMDSMARRNVSFYAENVHDFAWTCSPDFVYEHGEWNGIDVHAIFTTQVGKTWTKDVVEDGISAIRWLSEKFGPYPWPQMTITKALLGGGMEYPMLIMDASDSESLIVHEIGHNWFYGLFGNDELDDAWMDEGFTTFQTRWYQEHYYPGNGYAISRDAVTAFEAEHLPRQMYLESDLKSIIKYMMSPRNEPIATHSFDYANDGSYGTNAYGKASVMLHSLKAYLGEERFLAGMQLYYHRWSFKHVKEDRFIKAMEDATGEELDWFFDQWLHTTHYVDYALSGWDVESLDGNHFKTLINVKNKGGMFVPITASVYGNTGELATAPLVEFRYRDSGVIEVITDFEPDHVAVDAENIFLDVDRRNNYSERQRSWRYNYKGWSEYPDDRNLYLWKPQVGYNDTHGLGLGIRVDRVYRNPGNFIALELDHNLQSGNPDLAISFKKRQVGLPFYADWSASVKSWRSMTYASLAYELNWAKIFWDNPVHYLTISADFTDAEHAEVDLSNQSSFTRLGLNYDLQHDLFRGNYGFNARYHFSPSGWGSYGNDFSQLSLMSSWVRSFSYFKINNRTNIFGNYGATPNLVKSRIASRDLRSLYLDRAAASLHHTDGFDMIGTRYYLAGGGRLRGFADSLETTVNFLWSNNLDIGIKTGQYGPAGADFATFFDFGQRSNDGETWEWIADFGLGIEYKPSWKRNNWFTTIVRPFNLKLELPIMRYENGSWVEVLSNNSWVFSISN